MPGYSYRDHALLAALILCHRRKIDAGRIRDQGCLEESLALRLAALLRLAVRLNRTRNPKPIPRFTVRAEPGSIHLSFDATWLATRPLTRADLEEEARQIKGADIVLTWD
jgi:exopolyphosphatase/guanosine-5'-triphosphate,3'-diphosphate pyrophosphatase